MSTSFWLCYKGQRAYLSNLSSCLSFYIMNWHQGCETDRQTDDCTDKATIDALIWVAPGGSQFSCIRIGGQRPTPKTPYMHPQGAINHTVEQLRHVLGSGSGVNRYCGFTQFGILDLMLQNLTQIFYQCIPEVLILFTIPSRFKNKMQSYRKRIICLEWRSPLQATMKVARKRERRRERDKVRG